MTEIAKKPLTTQEVAARFHELAQQEKWFDIQQEFFSDDVESIDPVGSPFLGYAKGKEAVRKKGEEFVSRIEAVHRVYTSEPLVTGNHFAVVREKDLTVRPHGRIQLNEIMLYEVKNGQIISEKFFY
ncbi:nuclear transport factor 2 family protein [Pseudoflavitalea sp. G-6-1-2]|uniref:nuclear transport factor 2 family protein n=1 Tax=Pseudoflavitalea sp. G-6-1-2 TaxID=2728841 RepID=UPI001469A300|nr:nuclear transport factor 2 family protein [Pseudoflavitalea sp. G-6-1-2]NML19529.1 nuclear transport factor 2 family protein [Pseudoflavitalea sp. G-6-1-2]